MCGCRALWVPFRSGTADSSDWPGESGRDVFKLQDATSYNHKIEILAQNLIMMSILQILSWPLGRNVPKFLVFHFPHLPFVAYKKG